MTVHDGDCGAGVAGRHARRQDRGEGDDDTMVAHIGGEPTVATAGAYRPITRRQCSSPG